MGTAQRLLLIAGIVLALCAPTSALDLDANRAELEKALADYTTCNSQCAKELSKKIGNESVDQILETVGFIEGAKSDKISKKLKVLAFYAFLRSAYERGKTVVRTHKVCANRCDALNQEIVTLGRAGILGPMLRGKEVDSVALSRAEIWDAYLKYVKPIELPAEHRSEEWWKFIQSSG
jgi:hypothetical protein